MALPVSSLSVAMQGFADFLDGQFGQDVIVTLDTPARAAETAKDNAKAVLNLFAYRLAPSGFHAGAGVGDPLFLRASLLLTCFPNGTGTQLPDTDLRVLGHAAAVLHSLPAIPLVLPGAAPGGAGPDDFRTRSPTIYQMQAVLMAPQMEELNHIWTTQGGELAYRLSLAYELALIPVEPLTRRVVAPRPTSVVIEVSPSPVVTLASDGTVARGSQPIALALSSTASPPHPAPPLPAPLPWVPVQIWPTDAGFVSVLAVADGDASARLALAGPPGERVAVTVRWTRAGGAVQTQAAQVFALGAVRFDEAAAEVTLLLDSAEAGDRADVVAHPATAGGQPVPSAPGSNVLTLTVGA